jgi:pimeloyl-ACP methyl ester carboxylesterase/DNA-binding CsgD family transcriptional regulator
MDAPIQYARTSDNISIAYYCMGEGYPLVYIAPGSHLERELQYPEQRAWAERLAADYRLIRFDHRSTGMSDQKTPFNIDLVTRDIEAIVAKEKLQRFAIFGQLYSASIAVLYARAHPETVSHLIMWSPYASFKQFNDSSPPIQATRAAAAKDWQTHTELISQMITGWEDADQGHRFAAYLRAFSSESYRASFASVADFDLTAYLERLAVPVLILHRRDALFPTLDLVKWVAASTPKSQLQLLDGKAIPPFLGDSDSVLDAINQFMEDTGRQPRPDGLTEREAEILALLAGGNSNEEISRTLTISRRTVERHIGNIYLKIGAHNRAEATAYAIRSRIVPA